MNSNVLTRIGLTLAALCALTSFAFAQTPPRSDEVFTVWSSADRVLSTRDDFAGVLANEVIPSREAAGTGSFVHSSGNDMLIDEPPAIISRRSCFRVAAPRKSEQFHSHC